VPQLPGLILGGPAPRGGTTSNLLDKEIVVTEPGIQIDSERTIDPDLTPLEEAQDLLNNLPAVTRARLLGVVLNTRNSAVFQAMRVSAVAEVAAGRPRAEAARDLGVTAQAVSQAVQAHLANEKAQPHALGKP
jgi:hypothetical protein